MQHRPSRPGPSLRCHNNAFILRSVQPGRIVCLECGAGFKMLKRHLRTEHHLTPEGYRERWGLPRAYPMTAPDYIEVRSGIAKRIGLGHRRGGQAEAAPSTPAPARGRGRRRAKDTNAG